MGLIRRWIDVEPNRHSEILCPPQDFPKCRCKRGLRPNVANELRDAATGSHRSVWRVGSICVLAALLQVFLAPRVSPGHTK